MNIWEILQMSGKIKDKGSGGYTYTAHRAQHSTAADWAGQAARPRGRQGDIEGAQAECTFDAGTREKPNVPPLASVARWLGH